MSDPEGESPSPGTRPIGALPKTGLLLRRITDPIAEVETQRPRIPLRSGFRLHGRNLRRVVPSCIKLLTVRANTGCRKSSESMIQGIGCCRRNGESSETLKRKPPSISGTGPAARNRLLKRPLFRSRSAEFGIRRRGTADVEAIHIASAPRLIVCRAVGEASSNSLSGSRRSGSACAPRRISGARRAGTPPLGAGGGN